MSKLFLSFGTNCCVAANIKKKCEPRPTYFFDWIGCDINSIKSVSYFLKKGDSSFLRPENLMFGDSFFIHKDLYLLFGHEKEKEKINDVSKKYIRRFERTFELIRSYKDIILLCYIEERQEIPNTEDAESILDNLKTDNNNIELRILASEKRIKKFSNKMYLGLKETSNKFDWERKNLNWDPAFEI